MIVFKTIDEFSRESGKKIGSRRVPDFTICDYCGEKIEDGKNPVIYSVDYNGIDPCFGDHEAERWLYDYNRFLFSEHLDKKEESEIDEYEEETFDGAADPFELFGQPHYCFLTDWHSVEIFSILLKEAKKEKFQIISLDHLLRWSRGRMLERVIKEKKYNLEQFKQ